MDKEARLQEILTELRSRQNKSPWDAVNKLRHYGWLTNGALRNCNLDYANLRSSDLSKADLQGASLRHASIWDSKLIDINLQRAVLTGTNFEQSNLSGANLSQSKLKQTNFHDASLSGANLHKADMRGARLSRTNLADADLTVAVLRDVYFRDAIILRSNFSHAYCANTTFADVNLRNIIGIDTIQHHGPSHISIGTLYRSGWQVSEEFLRGCGVPSDFISSTTYFYGKVIEFYSCFISYSHAQKEFARRLHDRLQGAGIRCWLDEHQVKPGQDIYEEVNRGIRLWDKVLLCCSEESLTSWWVDNEIGTALEKEQGLMKERGTKVRAIIPLNLDGYMFDGWESGYAAEIRRRLAADFRNWKEHDVFEAEFQKVLAALRTDEGREEPPVSRL